MKKEIIRTADGSFTFSIADKKVTYHSLHGAIAESRHVFLTAGLKDFIRQSTPGTIELFEMGFGTGLNAFLTAIEALNSEMKIHYTAIDSAPLLPEEAALLHYPNTLGYDSLFEQLHTANWHEAVEIHEQFTLTKLQIALQTYMATKQYHVIYYDAFAPSAQPELWTKEIFEKLHHLLLPQGFLVTYCAKGIVRRAMQAAGFAVKSLPGPPRKREMLRATKV